MTEWEEKLDPADRMDFVMDFANLLVAGETIASYTLGVTAAAAALGLTIETLAPYEAGLVSVDENGNVVAGATAIQLWLTVDPLEHENAEFTAGAKLGVVATVTTSAAKPRRRQRTWLVEVKQQ